MSEFMSTQTHLPGNITNEQSKQISQVNHAKNTLKLLLEHGLDHPDTMLHMEQYSSKFNDNLQAIMYMLHQIQGYICQLSDYTYEINHVISNILARALNAPRYPTHYDNDIFKDIIKKEVECVCIAALEAELSVYMETHSKKKPALHTMHYMYQTLVKSCESVGITFVSKEKSQQLKKPRNDLASRAIKVWSTAVDEIRTSGQFKTRMAFADTLLEMRLGKTLPSKETKVQKDNQGYVIHSIDYKCKLVEIISDPASYKYVLSDTITKIIDLTKLDEDEITPYKIEELNTYLTDVQEYGQSLSISLKILNSLRRSKGITLKSNKAYNNNFGDSNSIVKMLREWLITIFATYTYWTAVGTADYDDCEALVKLFCEKFAMIWGNEALPFTDLLQQADTLCDLLDKQLLLGTTITKYNNAAIKTISKCAGFVLKDYITFNEEHQFNFLDWDTHTSFSEPITTPVLKPKNAYMQYSHRVETGRYNPSKYIETTKTIEAHIAVTCRFAEIVRTMPAIFARKW